MNNPEHTEVRLPVLAQLLKLGWSRGQIICPSPDSDDTEWRVPNPPSEHSNREAGRSFKGDPVDLVIFDSDENVGDPAHIKAIFEFKAPNITVGKSQLLTYLANEPSARYGFWTNGTDSACVYRLADGNYDVREGAKLPTPSDNLVKAGRDPLTYDDLKVPTDKELRSTFERILGTIAATDSISTRPEQRLNEMANLLIVKMESDKVGSSHPDRDLLFQIREDPEETVRVINELYKETKKTRQELFLDSDPNGSRRFRPAPSRPPSRSSERTTSRLATGSTSRRHGSSRRAYPFSTSLTRTRSLTRRAAREDSSSRRTCL